MPSILYGDAKVDFIARKNFRLNGVDFFSGDECPDINDHPKLEVFVRNGYVIPVVDDTEQLPFQFRRTVMTRELAYKKLRLGNPAGAKSNLRDTVGNTDAPEPAPLEPFEATPVDPDAQPVDKPTDLDFNPADHTIPEVVDWVENNPDEVTSVYVLEEEGKNRPTLLKQLDEILNAQMNTTEEEQNNG